MEQLGHVLAPNGIVAIVVPDARFHDIVGRARKIVGIADPYWLENAPFLSGFRVPDHLSSFQPRTISAVLRRAGYKVIKLQNAPVVFNPPFYRDAANGSFSECLGRFTI